MKNGYFVKSIVRWATFTQKILKLEEEAEFDADGNPQKVHHSQCTKTTTMDEVYHVKAFQDHVSRCKRINKTTMKKMPPKGMTSLNTLFAKFVLPQSEVIPQIIDVFCPGLNPANVWMDQQV